MENLPMGLDLQPNESTVRHWSLWHLNIYLTEERLVMYESTKNCTVARLDHVASVQSSPTVNSSQRSAGWVLLVAGAAAGFLGLYETTAIGPYGSQQTPTLTLVIGIAVAVLGLILVLTAQRTELYVTLSSSDKVHLAPRGYSDTKKLEQIMTGIGDALTRARTGLGAQQEEPSGAEL